jgi:hypothetical protein
VRVRRTSVDGRLWPACDGSVTFVIPALMILAAFVAASFCRGSFWRFTAELDDARPANDACADIRTAPLATMGKG